MKQINYKKLNNISIEGSGLINTNITTDPVYNFCVLNKITNIGDFVRIYTEKLNNGEISKKYNLEYFDGIIGMLMLVYCGIPLEAKEIFSRKIYLKQSKYTNQYYGCMEKTFYNSALSRLGFTNNEKKLLLNYAVKVGREMSVIEIIRFYLQNNLGIELVKKEQFIFEQKIGVYYKYYLKGPNFRINLESANLYKIEELLNKYEKLLDDKIKLEKSIMDTENEMKYVIEQLNEREVKQLQKKYPNKDFIAK